MFGLNSPDDFFFYIKRTVEHQAHSKEKRVNELFFIIMGLNHLREWIAPSYDYRSPAQTPEQQFFNEIWELSEFKKINKLCNGTKHLSIAPPTEAKYGLNIDDWYSIDDVLDFDNGPPKQFLVDETDIEDIINAVVEFYYENWFK